MLSVNLELDPAEVERLQAYAASYQTSIQDVIESYLRSIGEDVLVAKLPTSACRPFIRMFSHKGRDTTANFLASEHWDEFERPMPGYFFNWARTSPGVVIDGGANTGFYSLLAACAAEANRILAFEPDPLIRRLLRLNIDANELGSRVTVEPAALSRANGQGVLYVPSQDHGMIETSSSIEPEFKARSSEILEITTVTIDHVVGQTALQGQPVSLMKMDVAGHEEAVLAGAVRTVAEHRPVIFAEVLNRADFGALSRFIQRHNYLDLPLWPEGRLAPQPTVAFERDAWNHAFVPAEKLPGFLFVRTEA